MPLYEYKCRKCGRIDEVFMNMSSLKRSKKCKSCGGLMRRIFSCPNATMNGYPHWSRSLGVNTSQIAEAKKVWPDAVFNEKGDFLVTSRNCKLRQAKRRGMTELE